MTARKEGMLPTMLTRFPTIAQKLLGHISPNADEVKALLQIAFLSLEIDLDEDSDEMKMLRAVNLVLWDLADKEAEVVDVVSPLPDPIDGEARVARIRELVPALLSVQTRELAYAIAYLFTIADLAMQPVEDAYLVDLARELRIEPQRASDLVASVAEAITPAER